MVDGSRQGCGEIEERAAITEIDQIKIPLCRKLLEWDESVFWSERLVESRQTSAL